jgi:hypothetical protein
MSMQMTTIKKGRLYWAGKRHVKRGLILWTGKRHLRIFPLIGWVE